MEKCWEYVLLLYGAKTKGCTLSFKYNVGMVSVHDRGSTLQGFKARGHL